MIIEEEDALELGLNKIGTTTARVLADGTSTVIFEEYSTVDVSIVLHDGTSVTRPVRPVVQVRPNDETDSKLSFVKAPQRLMGERVLNSMGLSQDFSQHRLVKFIRRV